MANMEDEGLGLSTLSIHSFQPEEWKTRPIVMPLVTSTSYKYESPEEEPETIYSRYGNPTRWCLEETVARLEGAKYGLCFASGMATIHACFQLLSPGDGVVCNQVVYGGTALYFSHYAKSKGVEVTFVDSVEDPQNVKAALKENTKMVWMEICCNPTLGILDIEEVAKIVANHSSETILVVDNTFLTPYLIKPLSLGVTIVMHSMTKYMSGHGDLIMGCLATNREDLKDKLYHFQKDFGLMSSPFDCYMMSRSLKTLSVRMRQHCSNAATIAQFLEGHPQIERVLYPGLPSHPHHKRALKMLPDFGGMVSFYVKGDHDKTQRFLRRLKLPTYATSLGSTDSLVCSPWTTSHHMVPEALRVAQGVTKNLVRLSVGLEDVQDLVRDLKQALEGSDSQ